MSLEECVNYAIAHNPNLAVAEQQIKAAESGIGQQKASFAPRLTARVNYNHLANSGTRIANTHTDSIGYYHVTYRPRRKTKLRQINVF